MAKSLVLFMVLVVAACSDKGDKNDAGMDGGSGGSGGSDARVDQTTVDQTGDRGGDGLPCTNLPGAGPRAPAGDGLCAGRPMCSMGGSGVPDHLGCPNTCTCVCYDQVCYQASCTAIACSTPNVFR